MKSKLNINPVHGLLLATLLITYQVHEDAYYGTIAGGYVNSITGENQHHYKSDRIVSQRGLYILERGDKPQDGYADELDLDV